MILQENYKIENDGIWITKEELEKWRDHYKCLFLETDDVPTCMLYIGKHDVIVDLLKLFKEEENYEDPKMHQMQVV